MGLELGEEVTGRGRAGVCVCMYIGGAKKHNDRPTLCRPRSAHSERLRQRSSRSHLGGIQMRNAQHVRLVSGSMELGILEVSDTTE